LKSPKGPILIAEDNDDVRGLLQSFVESKGYKVITASDGSEALEVLKHNQPALIVMDLNMPVTDGFTAACRAREQERLCQIPIVFVTAHGTLGIELYQNLSMLGGGQIEYLPKPVDLQLFEDLIHRLIPESDQPEILE
jgi:two-component system, cell cycle response regulator DivK